MPLAFTVDDVVSLLAPAALVQARGYQRAGKATVEEIDEADGRISGTVKGSATRPYRVVVTTQRRKTAAGTSKVIFNGHCTCPVHTRCKHIGALLLQALEDEGAPVTRQAASPAISEEVSRWLTQIDRAASASDDEYAPDVRHRLIYVLTLEKMRNETLYFRVGVNSVGLMKGGSFSVSQRHPYDPGTPFSAPPAKYVTPADLTILRQLHLGVAAGFIEHGRGKRTLGGAEGAELLPKLLATGRCHWNSIDGPVLVEGTPRRAEIRWIATGEGKQRPELAMAPPSRIGLLTPPWYVDPETALCGPADSGIPPALLASFLNAPALNHAEVAAVRSRLAAAQTPLPLPAELAPPKKVDVPPVPLLRLEKRRLELIHDWSFAARKGPDVEDVPVARLSFLYGPAEIVPDETVEKPIRVVDGEMHEIHRRPRSERAALKRLDEMALSPIARHATWRTPPGVRGLFTMTVGDEDLDEADWINFVMEGVPTLIGAGWQVEYAPDFPFRLAETDGEIEAELREGSGIDWFDLNLGISVDGEKTDILPLLVKILRTLPAEHLAEMLDDAEADDNLMTLKLPDGRILPLRFGRIRPILRALAALFDSGDSDTGRVRLGPADAADLAGFEAESGVVWRGGDGLRALGRRLASGAKLDEIAVPASFKGSLRHYQQEGLAWLQLLREVDLGGVLADDMGLGKTVQVLAHLSVEKESGRLDRPCLVVAPTSLMPNWRAEAASFTPDLKVLVQHGIGRNQDPETLAGHDLVLTSYALLTRDAALLSAQPWHIVIADEAQFVKNPATASARALRGLEARHRLALTGTPLENHLGELWALFDFVSPGFLGDSKRFAREWRGPIEKRGDVERQQRLARRVRPFLLRRTKAEVATELPAKTEITVPIEMGRLQRDLYDGIRLTMHQKLREAIAAKGLKRSRIELLDALLKLRQACCDPRLVKSQSAAVQRAGSAKLERLMEMLPELIDEGRRILLFSQFTSMLALIEKELVTAKIPYVQLTGQTRDRATPVARFQKGEVPVFLISLKAGGTGLNLTAADTVIHYDPWWNPATEAQATDRAYRIGQDKPVFVHKLVTMDTIEIKMAELKSRKQALADGLFDPEGGTALDVSEADVEFLLGEGLG